MSKTITKFYGNGCMNCKAIAPILDGIKGEYPDIAFKDVNTSDDDDKTKKYGIQSIPTLVFEKDDVEVGRLVGLKPKSLIVKKIAEVF